MADQKPLPRSLRKRSLKAGYLFAFSLIGVALGFMLTHSTPTSTESQVQSAAGANHGRERSDTKSRLGFASVSDEPGTPTSAFTFAAARTEAGSIPNKEQDNPLAAHPGISYPEEEANDAAGSMADPDSHRDEEPGLKENALSSLLYELTRITPEDIPPTLSIQEFTAHVAALATNSLPEDPTVTDIRFGTSPRQSEPIESPTTRFSTYDARIYAVFDTRAYEHSGVLLKWYRMDQPEILILQKYEIDPHADYNYVWYKRKEGWPTGQYRVEVYSLGQYFRIISSGQYEVW